MIDTTEPMRRVSVACVNTVVESADEAAERARLEKEYGAGQVWNTSQLSERFEVISFLAPFCVVKDRTTGKKGSVMFQHMPRFYFGWQEDK
jgi:hypothetical protein